MDNKEVAMARGQRRSYDERIQMLDAQIQKEQDKLDALMQERDGLVAQKRDSELKELYALMNENNVNVDEVMSLVSTFVSAHKETA